MEQVPGIYRIDGPTGKFYVGSSKNLKDRWNGHRRELRRGTHGNQYLQNSWNKYGEDSFNITVLEFVEDESLLLEREQYWIDALDAVKAGYNISPTAGSALGCKHGPMSEERKAQISQSLKGRPLSVETIQKMTASRIGSTRSAETRKRMSDAARGRTFSEETRAKMAQAKLGKKNSEETKAKKLASAHWRRLRNALEKNGISLASCEMNTA